MITGTAVRRSGGSALDRDGRQGGRWALRCPNRVAGAAALHRRKMGHLRSRAAPRAPTHLARVPPSYALAILTADRRAIVSYPSQMTWLETLVLAAVSVLLSAVVTASLAVITGNLH